MADALRCGLIIRRLGVEDVGHEALRIAVIKREQARLHLHHDAVAGGKDMVHMRQAELVVQRLAGRQRRRGVEAMHIAAPVNLDADRQLHPRRLGPCRAFIGINVDQLDHPVAVGAAGGGKQVDQRLPGDMGGLGERFGNEADDIGSVSDEALVADQPGRPHLPVAHVHRARHEGHGVRRIGDIARGAGLGGGCCAELAAGLQVHRRQRAGGPFGRCLPFVAPGRIGDGGGGFDCGGAVLEIAIEKGLHRAGAELQPGITFEVERAKAGAVIIDTAVPPRADDEVQRAGVLVGECLVYCRCAIAVFLVPLPDDKHGRHAQRAFGEQFVERLFLPVAVIGGVLHHLARRRELFEAEQRREITGRPGAEEDVILVAAAIGHRAGAGLGRLAAEIIEAVLAEGAIMKPVIAHPAIDHRALRHRRLQGGVRIDQRHQRGEARVGRAGDADLPVRFGDVLHQPVDAVVRIGGIVDGGGVERAPEWPVHHIIAFGFVDAAHVLIDADIAIVDKLGVHDREDLLDLLAPIAKACLAGIIRGASQQHRATGGALAHDDDGEQLHAIAHRNHHFAADIIGLGSHRIVAGDHVGFHWGGLGEASAGKQDGNKRERWSDHKLFPRGDSAFGPSPGRGGKRFVAACWPACPVIPGHAGRLRAGCSAPWPGSSCRCPAPAAPAGPAPAPNRRDG